jgi:CheY-like chemotaxis protein
LVALVDVTLRKQAEEELLRAQKLESVGVLAAGIAHDFNNLLTGIVGNVSLAKMLAGSNARVVARLTEAENACQRTTALTHQLLTFAKGGAPVRQPIAIMNFLTESVAFAVRGSNVRPEFAIAEDLWLVDGDEDQMYQVIYNVVLNAVQAMPQSGRIVVQAENVCLRAGEVAQLQEGRYIKIAVQDYGCGIPKDVLPKIFDPYFTTKETGSGLGLAAAYAIVTKHDGCLTVTSKVAMGTTVFIYLPASQHDMLFFRATPDTPAVGSARILVMDDEEIIRDLLCETLTSLEYEVVCACDGGEAIALYQDALALGQPFRVVILDMTVPGGMGGKEAMAALRAIDPHVKALISSGYANDPVMANFAAYGFNGMVTKPYTVQRLQSALQGVLSA